MEKKRHDARTINERHQNWLRRAILEGLDTGKIPCNMIEDGVILLDGIARLSNAVAAGMSEGQGHPNAAIQQVKKAIITKEGETETVLIGVVVPTPIIMAVQDWWRNALGMLEQQVKPRPEVSKRNRSETKKEFPKAKEA